MILTANLFPGKCNKCRRDVEGGQGHRQKIGNTWCVWCLSCSPATIKHANPIPQDRIKVQHRVLTAEGRIYMPHEPQNLDLIRSFPGPKRGGSEFVPANPPYWQVSLKVEDRARVLELANKLSLVVHPDLNLVMDARAEAARAMGAFPYQTIGVDFLVKREDSGLLADEMGLGKTIQTLCAFPENSRSIIVAPATAKYNWKRECEIWRKDLNPIVVKPKDGFRFPKQNELLIYSFDSLPDWLAPQIPDPKDPSGKKKITAAPAIPDDISRLDMAQTHLVVDEVQRAKNPKAMRTKRTHALSGLVKTTWGLTGTPLENNPDDLWGVLWSIGAENKVFKSYNHFMECFGGRWNRFGGKTWGQPLPIVPELLRRVMLRRKRADVLPELPAKTHTTLLCDVSNNTKKKLDALWERYADEIAGGDLPPFEEFSTIRKELAVERIPVMLEMVAEAEEANCPLVVACAHNEPLFVLATRPGWRVITGQTSAAKRQEFVNEFQEGKLKGIAISIRAAGVAINLTYAWRMLFVDMDWTHGNNAQCADRLCRIGQESDKIEIVSLVSDHPLDIHVHKLLYIKEDRIDRAIDAVIESKTSSVESPEPIQYIQQFEQALTIAVDAPPPETEIKKIKKWLASSPVPPVFEEIPF